MKTIIFDLKNTLVTSDGQFCPGALAAIKQAKGARRLLYTMNEPWTYDILQRYPKIWQQFNAIQLVTAKQVGDLRGFTPSNTLVVGDSLTEELAFASQLGYTAIAVNGDIPQNAVANYIKGLV